MNNYLQTLFSNEGPLLSQPGDRLEARITKTGRKVIKLSTQGGAIKKSAVIYPTGTVVGNISNKIR